MNSVIHTLWLKKQHSNCFVLNNVIDKGVDDSRDAFIMVENLKLLVLYQIMS